MKVLALVASALIALPLWSHAAEDAIAKGDAIAREWDRRDQGFGDTSAELRMILQNRAGQTSERTMRIQTLEMPAENEGDKSLVVFDEPRDIKGTALLSYAHILDPDDQWLYLPALKRVKRISSANKSGPFVGSEFAYEDLTGQELRKYSYQWLRDEECGEFDCYVVERRPLYERSGYTRLVTWYDTEAYRVRRVEYYDRKNDLMKTLTLAGFRLYLGQFWRAHDLIMENRQTGKLTRLVYEVIEFQTGLVERDFTKSALARVR